MIRKPKTLTKCCPTCRRGGWKVQQRFALMTEEEQIECFGKRGYKVEQIQGAPANAERCYAGAGGSIGECVTEGVKLAKLLKKPVAFEFNGKTVVCREGDNPERLYRKWWSEMYHETPEQSFARR